jgi:hypothetical protein
VDLQSVEADVKNTSLTGLVVFGLLLAAGLYDLWAVVTGGVQASISQFVTDTVGNYPFLMFVCGMLTSHFFGFMMVKNERV